jgi:phage internal scaffolding protein
MSKKYCEDNNINSGPTTSPDMREHCKRPGNMDENGNPIYFTEQHHKKECDINNIIKKYDKTGLISHINNIEGFFGDLSGDDFKTMQDQVIMASNMFDDLPSDIRNRFENEPYKLLEFMDDPNNRDEAIELGLIRESWPESLDGIGEHIKDGVNVGTGEIRQDGPE